MSDANTTVMNPLANGMSTSEGKLTAASVVLGFVLSAFGAIQPMLLDAQARNPDNKWIGVACMLCGAVISGASLFGYNKGRALIKSTQVAGLIQAGAAVGAVALAKAIIPTPSPLAATAKTLIAPLPEEAPTPTLRPPAVPPLARP